MLYLNTEVNVSDFLSKIDNSDRPRGHSLGVKMIVTLVNKVGVFHSGSSSCIYNALPGKVVEA